MRIVNEPRGQIDVGSLFLDLDDMHRGAESVCQPGMASNIRLLIRAIWLPFLVNSRCSRAPPGVSNFIAAAWARN